MSFANTMSNSTGGLANLWCEKCKAEVLHRGSTCNHCGSAHVAYPVRSYADIWVSGLMSVKRKRRRKP
jgi:hypothetical protein